MILGLFWMLVANAAVLLAARATVRRLSTGRASVDLVLFLLFRFAYIMGLVIAVGLAGRLGPAGLGVPCALLLAVLLARGERFDIPWRMEIPRELPRWALVFAALLAIRGLVLMWYYTPIDGDAVAYHLPKIVQWVRTGHLQVDLGTDLRAWFPAGFELLEAWWVLFLHHDALIETAGLEFLLLAAASTWALARWLGLSQAGALLASLLVTSMPGLSAQSLACLNDAPSAALVLAGAALIVTRVPFPLLLLVGGLAAGLKPTTAYAAPGLLLLLFLVRRDPAVPLRAPWTARALATLGLAVGAYWYLRTWILTGSPIYPMGTSAIGWTSGKPLQRLGPSYQSLFSTLADLVNQRIYDLRRPYHPLLEYGAGWGPALVACGLPALLWSWRRLPRLRLLGAFFLVSLGSVLVLVVNDRFNLRFILWFPALLALAAAVAAERVPRFRIPAGISLGFTLLASTFTGQYSLPSLSAHLRRDRAVEGALWMLEVEPDRRIATFGEFGQRAYLLAGPDFRNEVVTIRADSPEELVDEMLRHGLRQLYAMDLQPKSRSGRIVLESVRRQWLRKAGSNVYFLPP